MNLRKIAALATAALLLVGAASCGSDSDGGSTGPTTTVADGSSSADGPDAEGTPSNEEIAAAMVRGLNVSQEQADCAAPKVAASDLPGPSLQAIVKNAPDSVSEEAMVDVRKVLSESLQDCP